MRIQGPILLLLLATACRTRLSEPEPRNFFAGVGVSAEDPPGLVLIAGQLVSDNNPKYDLFVEGHIVSQWGDGDLVQLEAGARHVLSPGHESHLYFRYGATWLRLVGDSEFLDEEGDYLGAYAGVGYEWDLTPRISVGPEIDLYGLWTEQDFNFDFLPRLVFQINVKF
jgi:hypothetical protein